MAKFEIRDYGVGKVPNLTNTGPQACLHVVCFADTLSRAISKACYLLDPDKTGSILGADYEDLNAAILQRFGVNHDGVAYRDPKNRTCESEPEPDDRHWVYVGVVE